MSQRNKCAARFAKLAELNRMIDEGAGEARKQKRSMSNVWTKRYAGSITGFHKPNAKGPRYE